MKALFWVRSIFLLVGLALFAGAAVWAVVTRSFIARAEVASGTVVALERTSSNAYSPVVDFVAPGGQMIEFRSSFGSSPPAYEVGEKVEVLYLPDQPRKARIRGIFALWGGALILCGVGLVFTGVGGGMALFAYLRERRNAELRQSGVPTPTVYQSIRLNTHLRVNGRHPYQVVTQWLNPATEKIHVFHSENLWFDPSQHIDRREITVYLDPTKDRKSVV
jgi:hypothetical protein